MARKLGFIDFMTKFVRGVKATFFGALFNKKEKWVRYKCKIEYTPPLKIKITDFKIVKKIFWSF